MKRRWKTIPEFTAYQVSRTGKIRRKIDGFIPSIFVDPDGYCRTSMRRDDGQTKILAVHRVVASAWLKQPSKLHRQVNHKDCDKQNNRRKNLEWVTPRQNTHHAIENGVFFLKKASTLTDANAKRILQMVVVEKNTIAAAARRFKVSERNVHDLVYGKIWKDLKGPRLKRSLCKNPAKRISDAKAHAIRIAVVAKGRAIAKIAAKHGYSESSVRRIVFGQSHIKAGGPTRKPRGNRYY